LNNIPEVVKLEKLTIKEASEYINKSTSWIRKKILNGEIEAKKESFKYGERYKIRKEELDNYQQKAKIINESVEVVEVEEKISKQDLMNELIQAVNSQNKALISETMSDISQKIESQEQAIKELTEEVRQLKKQQNKSLLDKVKGLFMSDKNNLKESKRNEKN